MEALRLFQNGLGRWLGHVGTCIDLASPSYLLILLDLFDFDPASECKLHRWLSAQRGMECPPHMGVSQNW